MYWRDDPTNQLFLSPTWKQWKGDSLRQEDSFFLIVFIFLKVKNFVSNLFTLLFLSLLIEESILVKIAGARRRGRGREGDGEIFFILFSTRDNFSRRKNLHYTSSQKELLVLSSPSLSLLKVLSHHIIPFLNFSHPSLSCFLSLEVEHGNTVNSFLSLSLACFSWLTNKDVVHCFSE